MIAIASSIALAMLQGPCSCNVVDGSTGHICMTQANSHLTSPNLEGSQFLMHMYITSPVVSIHVQSCTLCSLVCNDFELYQVQSLLFIVGTMYRQIAHVYVGVLVLHDCHFRQVFQHLHLSVWIQQIIACFIVDFQVGDVHLQHSPCCSLLLYVQCVNTKLFCPMTEPWTQQSLGHNQQCASCGFACYTVRAEVMPSYVHGYP